MLTQTAAVTATRSSVTMTRRTENSICNSMMQVSHKFFKLCCLEKVVFAG